MKFHYEFEIKKLVPPICYNHKLFLIGSCFTENIGDKLKKAKFKILENPNGILFNPVSVSEALISYINKTRYETKDLFYFNESWHSWKHHSRFSDPINLNVLQKINNSIEEAHEFLKRTDYLFITLGSAWTYRFTENALNAKIGTVAANNHKAPTDWFTRKLLSIEELLSSLDELLQRLFLFNPDIRIIFTISPVRHLREGAVENNRSKAVLINAVHHLVDKFDRIYYFPAYELVIDDLRDYRFFAEDLVHPNYAATQYVYEKLIQSCFSESAKKLIEEIESIQMAYHHKPFNPASIQHKKFLLTFFEKTKNIQLQNEGIDFSEEIKYFSSFIKEKD